MTIQFNVIFVVNGMRTRERVMSYEPDWNEPSFYTDEGEVCEVCTESPCLCQKDEGESNDTIQDN